MKLFSPLMLIAAAAGLGSLNARAETYGVHFLGNTMDTVTLTAGVVPIGGWNNITQAANTFVVNSSDLSTFASLTLSGPGAANGYSTGPAGTGGNNSLMHGYLDSGGNGGQAATGTGATSVTLTLTGLTGPAYNLYIYDMGDAPRPGNLGDGLPEYSVNGTNYYTATLGGTFAGFVQGQTQSTELSSYPSTLTNGNYILVSGVVPTAGGTITLVTNNNNQTFRSPLNGFELVAVVPEPSAVAYLLLGVCGAALAVRTRRRKLAAV